MREGQDISGAQRRKGRNRQGLSPSLGRLRKGNGTKGLTLKLRSVMSVAFHTHLGQIPGEMGKQPWELV